MDNKNIIHKRNIIFKSDSKKSMIITVPFGTSVEKTIEKLREIIHYFLLHFLHYNYFYFHYHSCLYFHNIYHY